MSTRVSIPPHLIQFVASPSNTVDSASEALEEWIIARRGKGDTLFEVSVGLAELEDRTPPHCSIAFARARYITNVPPPSDLTPPIGPFPLSRSASPVTILHHLLSQPPPSVEHSREVILEYVLTREMKMRDKKHGRGGKGTLGREGFEDIAGKLAEVEEGLRLPGVDSMQLSSNRQMGLALILSLRMSLSYFTSTEMGHQLLKLATPDAERVIVQHIRKRVAGEGRYAIGMELGHLEHMTARRPALRPAFRSAKARTTIPDHPTYQIPQPAPSKSACIKLITSFIKDVDGGIVANGTSSPKVEKSQFISNTNSPSTPYTPLAGLSSKRHHTPDPNSINHYVFELVSEFITREKREYMLKCKWAVKGRDALSKDLGDIESSVCLGKGGASPHASELIPAFLVLRRSFNLPKSTLPISVIEPYLDLLPAPPDEDDVPYREPSVANITAKLYMNPRLEDDAAYEVLEELIDSEREIAEASGAEDAEKAEYLVGLVNQIAKRFPDGSYETVFARIKGVIENPTSNDFTPSPPKIEKQASFHRRAMSSATSGDIQEDSLDNSRLPAPQSIERRLSHNRSASLPSRRATFDEEANELDLRSDTSSELLSPAPTQSQKPSLPPLTTNIRVPPASQFLSPNAAVGDRSSTGSATSAGAGWWDIVSAVENDNRVSLAYHSPPIKTSRTEPSLPPGAEAARPPELSSPLDESFNKLDLDFSATPSSPNRPSFPIPTSSPARRALSRALSGSPNSSIGSENSPRVNAPIYRPPPVPLNFDRPSFPSPTATPIIPSPALPGNTPDRSPPPVKSKLGTFGRSLSIASKTMLARSKEKEREKENNIPGKWNKDMVANIMGPPVERR